MEFGLAAAGPIVDPGAAGEPETPLARAVEQGLAKLGLGGTEGHGLEARAILTDVYTKGGAFAFVDYNLGLCQLAEGGSRISPEDQAAVRTRFARVLREYTLYNQTDLCRLRLEELARLTGPA